MPRSKHLGRDRATGRVTDQRKPQQPQPRTSRAKPLPHVPLFDWHKFDPSMIPAGGSFVEELTTYRDRLSQLLEHEGKYVVIKGRDVIGIFPTRQRAIREVVGAFGKEPALVKKIVATEPLGILSHAVL